MREFNDPSNLRRHEAACSGEKSDEPLTTQLSDIIEDQKPPKEKTEKKKDTEEQIKPHSCGYCHKVRSLTFKILYGTSKKSNTAEMRSFPQNVEFYYTSTL